MKPLDRIKTFHPELTAIRQDFHANPELGFEEHRTSDIVAKKLEALGIEVHRGVGGTGVVGVLREGNGPVVDRAARRHGCAADPRGERACPTSRPSRA